MTFVKCGAGVNYVYFNPHPYVRDDKCTGAYACFKRNFNPHPYVRDDLSVFDTSPLLRDFNPHPYVRDDNGR